MGRQGDDEQATEIPVSIMRPTHVGPLLENQLLKVGYFHKKIDLLPSGVRSTDRNWLKNFGVIKGFDLLLFKEQQHVSQ